MGIRIGIFATHPVQYHVPVWRALSAVPEAEVRVHYVCRPHPQGFYGPEFSQRIKWDVDLFSGYEQLRVGDGTLRRPASMRLRRQAVAARLPQFDCIVFPGYTHPYEWQLRRAAGRLSIPCVMRGEFAGGRPGRGPIAAWGARRLRRWFYRGISAFCSPGVVGKRHLLQHGVPEERIFTGPYCVDTAHFEALIQAADRRQARSSMGIDDDTMVILFSGRFTERKRPDLLVRAIESLHERSGYALIMLGSGPLWSRIALCGRHLLGDRFRAPGFVNQGELGKYFAAADVFVLPSEYETWGLVVNEAMQFGLPVIVSDGVGCAPDLVKDGTTGFVCPKGDALQLAKQLVWLSDNRELLRQMGERARRHIGAYSPSAAAGLHAAIEASITNHRMM